MKKKLGLNFIGNALQFGFNYYWKLFENAFFVNTKMFQQDNQTEK